MSTKTYDLVGGVCVNQSEYAFKHACEKAHALTLVKLQRQNAGVMSHHWRAHTALVQSNAIISNERARRKREKRALR